MGAARLASASNLGRIAARTLRTGSYDAATTRSPRQIRVCIIAATTTRSHSPHSAPACDVARCPPTQWSSSTHPVLLGQVVPPSVASEAAAAPLPRSALALAALAAISAFSADATDALAFHPDYPCPRPRPRRASTTHHPGTGSNPSRAPAPTAIVRAAPVACGFAHIRASPAPRRPAFDSGAFPLGGNQPRLPSAIAAATATPGATTSPPWYGMAEVAWQLPIQLAAATPGSAALPAAPAATALSSPPFLLVRPAAGPIALVADGLHASPTPCLTASAPGLQLAICSATGAAVATLFCTTPARSGQHDWRTGRDEQRGPRCYELLRRRQPPQAQLPPPAAGS